MPSVRPTGCASQLPGPGREVDDRTPSAPSVCVCVCVSRGGRRHQPTMEDQSPDDAGQTTGSRSSRAGRDEGGSRTLRRSAGGCTKRLGAAGTRGTMWKTASASPPPGGRPRLVADHTHKEPCTKIARAGTCSFLPISQRGAERVGRARVQAACIARDHISRSALHLAPHRREDLPGGGQGRPLRRRRQHARAARPAPPLNAHGGELVGGLDRTG